MNRLKEFIGFTPRQLKAFWGIAFLSLLAIGYTLFTDFVADSDRQDGITVYVGRSNQTYAPVFQVNLNSAPADSLELIPGIGPVLSERIVAYRDSTGGFSEESELIEVYGIGHKLFSQIEDYVVVGP